MARKAVVVGATGAIGAEVVGQLLCNGAWEKVVTVGRREMQVPPEYKQEQYKATFEQVVVNMDNLKTEGVAAFQGANDVFCCLGTTRKDAGSAAQFKKVDFEYVKLSAEAAKAAGTVSHFSLVTAQGANPNLWASDFPLFHGLLYAKTKGLAEEAVKAQGFASVAIWRPGLLDRGAKTRGMEKPLLSIMPGMSVKVSGVADLMLKAGLAPSRPACAYYEAGEIRRAAKEGRVAKPDRTI